MFELLNKLIDNDVNINVKSIKYKDIIKVRSNKNLHKAKVFIR